MSPEDPCASSGAFGGFCSTASEEIWEGLFLGTVEDTTQPYDLMVQCLPNEVKFNNCVGLSPACIVNNVHREYGIVRSLLLCSALHFRALSVWGFVRLFWLFTRVVRVLRALGFGGLC